MRRAPRPNGAGAEARDRSRAGPALPDGRRSPQRRLDVFHAMRRGVAVEVERPLARALTTADDAAEAHELALRPVGELLARVSHGPRRILPYGDGHALPERRSRLDEHLEQRRVS